MPIRLALIALFALGTAVVFSFPAHHDMAWFLHMSERFVEGARLYVDVVDVNPPLIVLLGVPAVLAERLGLWDITAFRVLVLLMCVGSILLSAALLRRAIADDSRRAPAVVGATFALLLVVPLQFGQREHLALLLLLPWCCAVAARADGRGLPGALAVPAGIAGGLALCVKPHYLAAWFCGEALLAGVGWFGERRRARRDVLWGFLRAEQYALFVTIAAFAAMVLLVFPEYTDRVAFARRNYEGLGYVSPWGLLFGRSSRIVLILCALGVVLPPWRGSMHRVRLALVACSIGLLAAAALQAKGWDYHWTPAIGLASVAAIAGAGEFLATRRFVSDRISGVWLAPVLAAALAVPAANRQFQWAETVREGLRYGFYQFDGLLDAVDGLGNGGPIASLSLAMQTSFPLVNYADVDWSLREASQWWLAAWYRAPEQGETFRMRTPHEMPHDERTMFENVVEDLARRPPRLLIVDLSPTVTSVPMDFLAYYSQHPAFAEFLTRCRPAAQVAIYLLKQCNTESVDGGSVWESNPPSRGSAGPAGFEDRSAHQDGSAPS